MLRSQQRVYGHSRPSVQVCSINRRHHFEFLNGGHRRHAGSIYIICFDFKRVFDPIHGPTAKCGIRLLTSPRGIAGFVAHVRCHCVDSWIVRFINLHRCRCCHIGGCMLCFSCSESRQFIFELARARYVEFRHASVHCHSCLQVV